MFSLSQLKSTLSTHMTTDENQRIVEVQSSHLHPPVPRRWPEGDSRSHLLTQLKEEIVADLATALAKDQTPQQIIINNVATTSSQSPRKKKHWSDSLLKFLESPVNRVAVFGLSGVGVYFVWTYFEHKWHMEEVQKKIDANILLRASQWAFKDGESSTKLFKW